MNTVFFILLTLFLIVLQTIILPGVSWFDQCFDLLIIEVLFLSFMSSHYSMIFAVVVLGCIMDSLSGVPFCFYVFSYLWVYIIVQLFKQLLFHQSRVFIFIISIVSILIQHGMLLFLVLVNPEDHAISKFDFSLLIHQVLWGLVCIPPAIWLVNVCWQNWIKTTTSFHTRLTNTTESSIDRIQ